MIRTGIAGADTLIAGTLIRILIHHPEVDIVSLLAPGKGGRNVSDFHYGLLGEQHLTFTDSIDLKKIDVIFVCSPLEQTFEIADSPEDSTPVIIDMGGVFRDYEDKGFVFGLSEINRKPLVRGARRASLPLPASSLTLVALYPVARNLLLGSIENLEITYPAGLWNEELIKSSCAEITKILNEVQLSFNETITPKIFKEDENEMGMRLSCNLKCDMEISDLERMYEEIFDDHSFTILANKRIDTKEVLATNRCVVSLFKDSDGTLRIEAVADPRMRGGAAEGVHIMNLLFGLHEKTGMNFIQTYITN